MILGGLSACAQNQNSGPNFGNATPITIGIALSLTKNPNNDFSSDGQSMEQGYQLWADTVNNSGGILGRPVKLIILDDKSDDANNWKVYYQLIHTYHVDLILGPFSTLLTKAAESSAAKSGLDKYAFVEGAGGAPSVFTNGWTNLFAVSVPVENNLATYAYYILSLPKSQRPTTAAYLSSDDPFTFPQVLKSEQLLEQGGVKTVVPYMQYTEGDPKAPIAADTVKIIQSKAQLVVLGTLLPDLQAEIKVFKQYNYNPRSMIATAGPDLGQSFISAIGGVKYSEGVFVPNGWYPQANNFQNAQMVQAYLAKYGGSANNINADVAEAFSAGQVLQEAVEQTRSLNNQTLINYLHNNVFNTVQGTAKFAQDGHNEEALAYLFQWQSGQLIPVYPASAAAENPEYEKYQF